jgi:Flp pilus assembly pilin Flp
MRRKASSLLDYALLFLIVTLVIIGMGTFVRRSLMGKYKEAGDAFGHGRLWDSNAIDGRQP